MGTIVPLGVVIGVVPGVAKGVVSGDSSGSGILGSREKLLPAERGGAEACEAEEVELD